MHLGNVGKVGSIFEGGDPIASTLLLHQDESPNRNGNRLAISAIVCDMVSLLYSLLRGHRPSPLRPYLGIDSAGSCLRLLAVCVGVSEDSGNR